MVDRVPQPPPDIPAAIGRLRYPSRPGAVVRFTAEDDLIEHASHGDEISASRILRDAGTLDEEQSDAVYGEADEEGIPGER